MVYEHLLGCLVPKDPFLGSSKLFQVVIFVAHGDIFRLVALVLKASILLIMAKDTIGLCLIVIVEVFF
jgi:hypothetical protein